MTATNHFARALRLRRLFHHGSGLFVVPLDHSVTDGPVITAGTSIDALVRDLAAGGVDAVVLHKGALRHIRPERFVGMSLIVHLSASTGHAPDPDAKYLVTDVEEALRLGADAVSVHVNVGSREECRQIGDLSRVSGLCDRWNVPLLAMMYLRGPDIVDPRDPEAVLHAATVAADLGADVVKTAFPGTVAEMADITAACPIPLIVAGGAPMSTEDEVLAFVSAARLGGATGAAMGRNIFRAADPRALATRVSRVIHEFPDHRIAEPTGELGSERYETVLA